MKSTTKFILILLTGACLSLGGGYFGSTLFKKETTLKISQNDTNNVDTEKSLSSREIAEEKEVLNNLTKTYLYASTHFEWDVLTSLTTGLYKKELEEKIIPNSKKEQNKNTIYEFKPNSFQTSVLSLDRNEAILLVDYILNRGEKDAIISVQQKIKMYIVKENGRWLIFSVEVQE